MLREKQIFLDAIESCPPHAWETYVENACADDQALQARVRALLNAHIESNPLIDGRPVFEIRATTPLLERPGMKIGPFELLKEIGEGGFGIVFLSEQTEPLRRRVALKILKPGLDSRKIVARFEAERQALAMMDHVNIARVLDAGLAPSGRPYFVMDLVDGVSITEYCDNKRLSIEARMQLARDVCIAIQHAHLKGIIHRDLKPNNVMVTEVDGQPVVKVIDFGIAKATSTDATPQTVYSQHVGLMGTPAYMSPEQMSLGAIDIDLRSDVYSLGVLLYELVTGVTPIEEQDCRMDFDQLRQRICEVEAISPSARIAAMPQGAQQRLASTRAVTRLLPQVRNELDWIILKALEKPRERRYQSASDLADDLQRYLNHLPVHAGPPSARYQLQKFARRHFKAIAATTVVILSLALGTVFSVRKAREATHAKIAAVEALELNTKTLVKLRESEKQLQNQLYATRTLEQWQAWHDGDTDRFARLRRRTGSSSNTQLTDDFSNRLVHALSEQPPIVLGETPCRCTRWRAISRWKMVCFKRPGRLRVYLGPRSEITVNKAQILGQRSHRTSVFARSTIACHRWARQHDPDLGLLVLDRDSLPARSCTNDLFPGLVAKRPLARLRSS